MTNLSGLRVLVVEDEGAVALLIESMLEELGCIIVSSVGHLAKAAEVAATAQMDLALLDVNLHGQFVFPVADILTARNIPIVFSTGYGARGLPAAYSERAVLSKPFSPLELRRAIASAVTVVP